MKIRYKRRQLRINLILAVIWLIITIAQLYLAKNTFWLVVWLAVGGLNFSQLAYRYWMPYVTLKEDLLIRHEFLNNSSIKLSESTKIKRFAGDYIFQNSGKKLADNTQLIEPTSLTTLDTELEKYNIKWE